MLQCDLLAADSLLDAFLRRTGVRGQGGDPTRRYLWTDSYAVLALLALARARRASEPVDEASRLAHLVHRVLGRHRPDDVRTGWISGLDESEGASRPTAGGLRIGKRLPERGVADPVDEFLEWERDGQYFHYLTRWMEALAALAEATDDALWTGCAGELADSACAAFLHSPRAGAPPRIYWKMSIDLSRPLVRSMGLHDALDGYAAVARVRATARRLGGETGRLTVALEKLRAAIGSGEGLGTTDPLGIGGLLHAASELMSVVSSGDLGFDPLLHTLLAAAHRSMDVFAATELLSCPLDRRLAFRELGLAIGVQLIEPMLEIVKRDQARLGDSRDAEALGARLDAMSKFSLLARHLEETWLSPAAQATRGWIEHADINGVMLSASLVGVGATVCRPNEVLP